MQEDTTLILPPVVTCKSGTFNRNVHPLSKHDITGSYAALSAVNRSKPSLKDDSSVSKPKIPFLAQLQVPIQAQTQTLSQSQALALMQGQLQLPGQGQGQGLPSTTHKEEERRDDDWTRLYIAKGRTSCIESATASEGGEGSEGKELKQDRSVMGDGTSLVDKIVAKKAELSSLVQV